MKFELCFTMLRDVSILVLLIVPTLLKAAEFSHEVAWARQIGTAEYDLSHDVTVDTLGNLFLAWTFGELSNGYDTALSNYDLDGNLQWTRTFDSVVSDLAYALSSDGAGNAYLGGVTVIGDIPNRHSDAYLKKLDSDGNTLWERQFGSVESDEIVGISANGLGHVYVSGQTTGFLANENAGRTDAFVSKFDEAGNQLWTRQFGTGAADVAWDVSADALGNVFISGTTLGVIGEESFGSADTFTIKLDVDGETVWVRQWGSPYYDQSYAVEADGVGGAFIAGYGPSRIYGPDAFVGRYDADGNLMWLNYLVTEMDDAASGLALDDSGNIYVSGTTRGTLVGSNAGENDSFISMFSSEGIQQWVTQFGSDLSDIANGLAVDSNGGIYSSGLTRGSLAGPHLGGRSDAYLLKFDGQSIPEPGSFFLVLIATGYLLIVRVKR